MMNREEQVRFLEEAEGRAVGYLRRWLAHPEFRAALHRQGRSSPEGETSAPEK